MHFGKTFIQTKQHQPMSRFLSNTELYQTVLGKSLHTKQILWVCSTSIGLGAHRVFSQEILKTSPVDMRFVFQLDDAAVKRGEVNPYEIQYLIEHFRGIAVKSNENFHSNIYIFDDSALITSAALTEAAFENNIEAGVLLEGSDAEQVKAFFTQNLWDTSKALGDLKKYKLLWNLTQKSTKKSSTKKVKPHTQIQDWTNAYTNTWYMGVSNWLSKKSERKVKKETSWQQNISVLGDVGYHAFTQVKLGDFAYIADSSKRGKVEVEFVRIMDKARVETDDGDYHCSFEIEQKFVLERDKFFDLLKHLGISSKTSESTLNDDQLKQVADVLSSIKRKRKKRKLSS
jgi:hypothetical protein